MKNNKKSGNTATATEVNTEAVESQLPDMETIQIGGSSESKKVSRPGAGRTKGSTSFVSINVDLLRSQVPQGAMVVVSRKFAEAMGIKGTEKFDSSPFGYLKLVSGMITNNQRNYSGTPKESTFVEHNFEVDNGSRKVETTR